MRWACREHDRSFVGGALPLISSCRVGCKPVGWMKEEENANWIGWCRAGKENRVGEGLMSSPTTVRKPPKESSSGSFGDSTESTPTSRRSL